MSQRFALLYSDEASRTLDNILKNDPAAFGRIVAALRAFADNPFSPGAPAVNSNGVAKLKERGLFTATCHVARTSGSGGVVTTIKLIALT